MPEKLSAIDVADVFIHTFYGRSDSTFSIQAPRSPGIVSATDGVGASNVRKEKEHKRYERGLVSIRDQNLQLLAR
jgi:hypothetical protein